MYQPIVQRLAMYRFLMVLTIAATADLQIWRTLFNNQNAGRDESATTIGQHNPVLAIPLAQRYKCPP
jgi:hypothetical protein